MQLFASLSNTEAFATSTSSSIHNPKRPAFPPTAVQLYSTKYIDFVSNSVLTSDEHGICKTKENGNNARRHFQPLSYQAIRTTLTAATSSSDGGGSGGQNDTNLGVWDCRISIHDSTLATSLLKGVFLCDSNAVKSKLHRDLGMDIPTFLLALDLDEANGIQPAVASMIETITQYCHSVAHMIQEKENHLPEEDGEDEQESSKYLDQANTLARGTTNLSILQSTIFGKAPISDSNNSAKTTSIPDTIAEDETLSDEDKPDPLPPLELPISIIICGIFSKDTKEEITYKEKQTANLISYHLQKYASEINCTLCFLKDDGIKQFDDDDDEVEPGEHKSEEKGESNDDGGEGRSANISSANAFRPEGMNVSDFAVALRNVCTTSLPKDEEKEGVESQDQIRQEGNNEEEDEEESSSAEVQDHVLARHQPSIYAPHQYDVDLINSVLLRGASCPGVWNANMDDLSTALPPHNKHNTTSTGSGSATNASKSTVEVSGDDEWLSKLSASVNAYVGSGGLGSSSRGDSRSVTDQSVRTTRTSASSSVVTKKKAEKKKKDNKDDQDVADFFAGLLNK